MRFKLGGTEKLGGLRRLKEYWTTHQWAMDESDNPKVWVDWEKDNRIPVLKSWPRGLEAFVMNSNGRKIHSSTCFRPWGGEIGYFGTVNYGEFNQFPETEKPVPVDYRLRDDGCIEVLLPAMLLPRLDKLVDQNAKRLKSVLDALANEGKSLLELEQSLAQKRLHMQQLEVELSN